MIRRRTRPAESVEMQMTPMIDIVFLLLVFFIVTSRPQEQESDLSLTLPGTVAQDQALEIPDEQRVVIGADGSVELNELVLGEPGDQALARLVATLARFRLAAEANRAGAMVTLAPHDDVAHQRVMDVLNACAKAGLHNVSFAGRGEGGA
jgi:biopolymer transport protein ExbD